MPAVDQRTLRLEGFRELSRAFALADRAERKLFRDSLREVAEPVRADAETLAVSRIARIGVTWSRMRVGVTRTSVYVAPKPRGTRGRGGKNRPNLADLLMERAMSPALDAHQDEIEARTDRMLGDVARLWERA